MSRKNWDNKRELLGAEVSIEAYEDDADPGYKFQVLGKAREVHKLYRKLLGKMQRALIRQHIIEEKGTLAIADDVTVRGRFDWYNAKDEKLPLPVISCERLFFISF